MNDLHAAGLIMSAIVAVAAWMLGHWERGAIEVAP